eukprot:TRINITY_DN16476_c0_g2_i1.p1 TRINITY_DN16476_c0_g2~~TRINITY_DN16476_c0_g2_i1.p1  ORF type:complete len:151 (+),score=20.66 TRINITY_DN16476_c0_g2_i1:198-650(+)
MAAKAIERRRMNLADQLATDTLIPATHKGCIPLLNPAHHKFRDESFVPKRSVLYLTSAQRASLAEARHKELFLNVNEPFRERSYNFRTEHKHLFIQPNIQYKEMNENERVLGKIRSDPRMTVEQLNTHMLFFPNFRGYIPTPTVLSDNCE